MALGGIVFERRALALRAWKGQGLRFFILGEDRR
jgi:hypothetical protein